LARALSEILEGTYFSCTFSRLVIDPNRDITAQDLIPASSDQIPIPGNQMLDEEERQNRITRFFNPYHDALNSAIDDITDRTGAPFLVSVHSFTKRMMGAARDRPWHAGLLWHEDEKSARAAMAHLSANSDWCVGDNEPYDGRIFNYSIDRHAAPRRYRHLTFEIRQDMITTHHGVEQSAVILSDAIRKAAEQA